MPRETLQKLDRDVERLLMAGGNLVGVDDYLKKRHQAIATFAEKVPALAPLAQQIDDAIKSKSAAAQLLQLAVSCAQLRAAQAQPAAAAGELKQLPKTMPLETNMPVEHLQAIRSDLKSVKKVNLEIIRAVTTAAENGSARDLRLLNDWLAVLELPSKDFNQFINVVVEKVMPLIGDVVIDRLIADFNIKGTPTDRRRLEAIASIQGVAAKELLIEALKKGSPTVRLAAMTWLAKIDVDAAEPFAREIICKEGLAIVVPAAAEALKLSDKAATIEWLLDGLILGIKEPDCKDNYYWKLVARDVLAGSKSREVIKRLFDRLVPEGTAIADRPFSKVSDRKWLLSLIEKRISEARDDKRVTLFLMDLWNTIENNSDRLEVGYVILKLGDKIGLTALVNSINFDAVMNNPVERTVAIKAIFLTDPDRAYQIFSPLFDRQSLPTEAAQITINRFLLAFTQDDGVDLNMEPRWIDLLFSALKNDEDLKLTQASLYLMRALPHF